MVFATTIGIGILLAGASNYPPPVLPPGLHCTHVNGFARVGRTVQVTISGSGFHGQPSITSNAAGTRPVVTDDHRVVLIVLVSVNFGSPKGTYTFTITNPDSTSCKLCYTSK